MIELVNILNQEMKTDRTPFNIRWRIKQREAKLPKLKPTVCERTGGYEAYILEIKKNYP